MHKLQEKRLERNLSQKQLADKSGISKRVIQSYEQNKRDINLASLKTLIDLAIALNTQITEIITDNRMIKRFRIVSDSSAVRE